MRSERENIVHERSGVLCTSFQNILARRPDSGHELLVSTTHLYLVLNYAVTDPSAVERPHFNKGL